MEVSGRRTVEDDNISQGLICRPCQEDNVIQQAHGYCINCKEYLCETCYKYHRLPKPSKDHVLVDGNIDEYQSEKELDQAPPSVPERKNVYDTKCRIHQNEDLKYRCRAHNTIVCSVCALKQHKECKNVDYIPEICDSESRLLVEKIEYVEGKVEYILKQDREALQLAEESYESALSALKTQRCQINRYFEETEKQISDKMLSFREKSKKREEETLGIDQKLKAKKMLLAAATPSSEIENYISISKTEDEVNNINAKLQGVFGRARLTISYNPHQPLQVLGEAIVEQQEGDVGTRKLKLLRKVNIAGGKAHCGIIDVTMLPNNRVLLILVDRINSRLIIISKEYNVSFHQVPSEPWGVTYISDTKIAVSFVECEQVQIIKVITVKDTISLKNRKSFKVLGKPLGIRYRKSDCSLLIAFNNSQRYTLEYWSLDGNYLRTVASCEYSINFITLTADEKILYSSAEKHLVCLLEPDGKVLKSFQYADDDSMCGPYGIASDAFENIYVCGQMRLRVVSKEGKWEQILAQEDGFAPMSILSCDKTKILFVCQAKRYEDVLVFQI
ncbi:uncharacterized protein LOC123563924 [Mercenaria mercenaria]|uniref:uncharacterized protein LOC123563924 n=1 Tax=Mercenaria mercenaria TaxID=6596 RepID=UPI00234F08A5|nr:uncharacterized protein LOC123563924 [Mercenaria mercenaria]